MRIGRYRVVYAIDDAAGTVILVRVAKRSETTNRGL
ncbi:MAG: type II toxin-antitoxin system RelE/ParE family toxin [Candidatus Desulforudis sp.]|nr:type II toxin-antitoxin system RelE/ParE family toxin [Desulforudis sp.]